MSTVWGRADSSGYCLPRMRWTPGVAGLAKLMPLASALQSSVCTTLSDSNAVGCSR